MIYTYLLIYYNKILKVNATAVIINNHFNINFYGKQD